MEEYLENYGASVRDGSGPSGSDPVVEAARQMLNEEYDERGRTVSFLVDGEPYVARISTVGFSDLVAPNTIVLAAPVEDFLGPSLRLLFKNLAIAGLFLSGGILAALLVARLISRAMLALSEDARHIGNLEFAGRTSGTSWISEINTLTSALTSAREAIKTFALYVPRELVRKIVTAGQATAGAAVRQEVTVLFTDIRDFTTISEQHSPEDVVRMLSDYFQLMNEIVVRHNGVIIQYLGDSIYAMWNAPTPDPTHVDDACHCALDIKAEIDDFNRRRRGEGQPELVTRYGIHTGVAVVGSVGAQSRQQYTAMGDTVNVASRLEGMNKQYGTTILVSGAVHDQACAPFVFKALVSHKRRAGARGCQSSSWSGGPGIPDSSSAVWRLILDTFAHRARSGVGRRHAGQLGHLAGVAVAPILDVSVVEGEARISCRAIAQNGGAFPSQRRLDALATPIPNIVTGNGMGRCRSTEKENRRQKHFHANSFEATERGRLMLT